MGNTWIDPYTSTRLLLVSRFQVAVQGQGSQSCQWIEMAEIEFGNVEVARICETENSEWESPQIQRPREMQRGLLKSLPEYWLHMCERKLSEAGETAAKEKEG